MGVLAERNKAMDDNLRNWMRLLRNALREEAPTTLVGAGFFNPYGNGYAGSDPDDPQHTLRPDKYPYLVARPGGLLDTSQGSPADFVDIHQYPHYNAPGLTPEAETVEQAKVLGQDFAKPRLMGEVGATAPNPGTHYPIDAVTPAGAASLLTKWISKSCTRDGGHFAGWLHWIHDTSMYAGARDFWDFQDNRDPGLIVATAVSPKQFKPCG